jgi:hypothetical protein
MVLVVTHNFAKVKLRVRFPLPAPRFPKIDVGLESQVATPAKAWHWFNVKYGLLKLALSRRQLPAGSLRNLLSVNNYMKYSVPLKLDLYPLVNTDLPTDRHHTRLSMDTQVNRPVFQFFDNLNLEIGHVEIFFMKPNAKNLACHIDGSIPENKWQSRTKLNLIIGGHGSTMNWYDTDISLAGPQGTTTINTSYIPFDLSKSTLIESTPLSGWNLVEVGIPHAIFNLEEPRWCISIFFKKNKDWVTLADSKDIFENFIA